MAPTMIRAELDPETWREFRRLALALGVSTQQLAGEAILERLQRATRERREEAARMGRR
jgi:hypothetical protein